MKKILLIALILFTTLAYSQKPKVSAVRYTAVTTTERDNFTVPAGEFWRIYNTTTTQNEYWDGDSWEALSISEATFNLNSKNYSWGESYIYNWRDLVLDDGATYFPNNGGYEIGRLHQAEINTSLHFIPAAVGEGVIYAIGKNRINDLDVDRAALATYIDEDRILRTAAFDFARIDYTDGDGAILAEDQSTNLALWSEDYTDVSWVKYGVSVNLESTILGINSTKIDASNINEKQGLSNSISTSDEVTISCFAKKGEYDYIFLGAVNNGNSRGGGHYFNLNDGSVSGYTGSSGITTTTEIKEIITGIYRVSITIVNDIENVLDRFIFSPSNNNTNALDGSKKVPIFQGDGTSGIYITGAQVEANGLSSYIKTEGTSATRLADLITGAGDVNTFNSEEGVLYVEMAAFDDPTIGKRISISDGSLNNYINLYFFNSMIFGEVRVSNVNQAVLSYTPASVLTQNKIAIKWRENDFALWVNGVERDTDGSGSASSVNTLNTLNLDRGDGSSQPFYGKIRQLKVYKSISDAQLDFPYITNFFPLLLIGFRRRNQYKIAA